MTTPFSKNLLSTLLIGITAILFVSLYGCNDSEPKKEEVETVAPTPGDTMTMKMNADTMLTDTSGKGGQPTPPRK